MEDRRWRRCGLKQRLESDNDRGCSEDAGGEASEAPGDVTLENEAEDARSDLGVQLEVSPDLGDILNREIILIAICYELQKHNFSAPLV